ncbi:MAG: penicillin-binding protein 1C [Bacteroidales bacterium]|nr:penicillin-binding protein 1C [Bacteroidales bacterium]MCF8458492.1 penicillin-binding protein 1C [Bacteroidales bacterium]
MRPSKIKIRYGKLPAWLKRGVIGIIGLLCIFILADLIFPLKINIPYSTLITDKNDEVFHAFLSPDDKWRMFIKLDEISNQLEKTILHKEDKYFYYHPGINPAAIIRAGINNITQNRRTSGASTITMQVARLLNPKERSYSNKLREMFRALQLELHFSKKEIFQLYLNLVPYGGNIEGVKAASYLYFGKSPDHLSLAEITVLAIIPNRPTSLRIGYADEYIQQERNRWLQQFKEDGLWDDGIIADAIDEPFDGYRRDRPRLVPHLANRLFREYPSKAIIETAIDLSIQQKTEKIVKDYSYSLYAKNIHNAAVLILDNKSHEVLAYLGSSDFYDNQHAGQVDGIRAIRSPGSTLKPFLYGKCFEAGLITPKSVVSDLPVNFYGYQPENYTGHYNGMVTVEYALINSLNVPAVNLLDQYSIEKFTENLAGAGFDQIKKDEPKLGLSLILGGCGVSLEELCNLFSAFSNSGLMIHASLSSEEEKTDSLLVLSPGAAFMVTEILTQLNRPDFPQQWQNIAHLPRIAWKTGTSYGRRDAWSIGYNHNYTVGVWVGNFSGEGVPGLSGADAAAPLLFSIFNAIDRESDKNWNQPPDDVDFRYICTESGLMPSDFCDNQIIDYFIPEISSSEKCRHLKTIFINPDSTLSYCSACMPASGFIKAKYPNYSPALIEYFEQNQIKYQKIPPHNADCEKVFTLGAPAITSPTENAEYFLSPDYGLQLCLKCQAAPDVETVYWYINNKFIAESEPGQNLFSKVPEGKVKISCSDDKGRNTDIEVNVVYVDL